MIGFDAFDIPATVQIDWEYALKITEYLDVSAEQECRIPIKGKTAARILAEYAAIAHHCCFPPENTRLAVVVS